MRLSKTHRSRLKFVTALLALILLAIFLGAAAGYQYLGPYKGFDSETFVEIEHGKSSRAIGRQLAERGVVRSEWAFLFVRLLHPSATLQAGEYRFRSAQSAWQVFNEVRRGLTFYEEFTVPEGSNIFDIAALLRSSDTVKPDDFLKAAGSPESIRDMDPGAPSLEGFLFPSTYRLTHKSTGAQLCRMMTREFRKQWARLGNRGSLGNVHEAVTLASLVEKESALPSERALVAAVFINRLRIHMPLQCDPTTIYAALLENRYVGVIHKSDLASKNPYNTYTHSGLPLGPITNPGAVALSAALRPADKPYLYFVAKPDGSGSHHFSSTLDEHERAVTSYRATERSKRNKSGAG